MDLSSTHFKTTCVLFVYLSACNRFKCNVGMGLNGTHFLRTVMRSAWSEQLLRFFAVFTQMLSICLLPANFPCILLITIVSMYLMHSCVIALKTLITAL